MPFRANSGLIKTTMKNYQEYYRQMGNLMYCIAAADGKIADREWTELRRIVREELVPAETHQDDFGSDAAFSVEFQFDVLDGNDVSFEQAWEELEEYLKHNAPLLPAKDNSRLYYAAEKVAAAFHGISKAENRVLSQLRKLLIK
jgi:hypothetical protein